MIREVRPGDAQAIAAIYNEYVLHSVATFDMEPVTAESFWLKVSDIAASYPCFVYEEEGEVVGYCYAHAWKEKAAYAQTLETTVYLRPDAKGRGLGRELMERLIADCRAGGFRALIACITEGNEASFVLHERLGFRRVSHFEKVGLKFGRALDVIDYELQL